jgi:inner membrane protein
MDNLTHSLVGWALGQTGLKRKTRKGLAALIMGANAPDVDVFFGWVTWEPLATHRGITHSLIAGLWVMPLLTAGFLWLLDRWQVRRGANFASGLDMRFGWLLALAFIGCLTHPLLDWQTVYAVQLFSPFDLRWYHNDALFIVDVWVILALGGAIWFSRRRESLGLADWTKPARVGLAAVAAYICLNGAIGSLARATVAHEASGPPPTAIVASPPPVRFWQRDVVWREYGGYRTGAFDPLKSIGHLAGVSAPLPVGMADPRVLRAARDPAARKFLAWSIMPVATVTETTCGTMVRLGDARYRGFSANSLSRTIFLPTGGVGCGA